MNLFLNQATLSPSKKILGYSFAIFQLKNKKKKITISAFLELLNVISDR